jgi:hypothetical protein
MANYLSRLAVTGARVGFDARPSSLPPASLSGLARPRMERETGHDAGRVFEPSGGEDTIDVVEPCSTTVRASVKPGSLSRQADESIAGSSQGDPLSSRLTAASPPETSPAIPNRIARSNPSTPAESGGRTGVAADFPLRDPSASQDRSLSNEAATARRQSEETSQLNTPADSAADPAKGATLGERAPRRLDPTLPRLPSISEILASTAPSAFRRNARNQGAARLREGVEEQDRKVIGRSAGTAAAWPNLPSRLPSASKSGEPEARITIGRVEVQVNNQPSASPTPAPATKAGSGRQDNLQRRFLDRFTLRP